VEAQVSAPLGQTPIAGGKVIFDDDGWMILADNGNHRVRTVDPDGIIHTLAGTGEPGASDEGVDALEADLNRPSDVAIGPDGRLYIADTDNHCVRRLETDGTLSTIIGKCGKGGAEPTGIAARDMRMYRPFGIAFDPDGLLYVVDTFNHRIMRMRTL
jgi:sugar lactone lactonase YvrE